MSVELATLIAGALLSLALALLTVGVHFARFGGKTIRSNRDDYPPLTDLAARVTRAHANLNEALVPFAIVALAAAALHVSNGVTVWASAGFLAARLAHAALYVAGSTPWRSISFYCGLIATIVFATQLAGA